MPRRVSASSGEKGVVLPEGWVLDSGDEVVVSDAEWAEIQKDTDLRDRVDDEGSTSDALTVVPSFRDIQQVAHTGGGGGGPGGPHTHNASDLNSGTVDMARLPVASDGEDSSTELVRADDLRLSNPRTPTAHGHAGADITSGTVSISRLPVADDGESNAAEVVRSNDARLSNSRTPTAHVHAAADVTSGVFPVARLGTGTPDDGMYVDGGTGAWTPLPDPAEGTPPYRARMKKNTGGTDQTITGSTTQQVILSTVVYEYPIGTCDITDYTITIPADGEYLITANVRMTPTTVVGVVASGSCSANIVLNGAIVCTDRKFPNTAASAVYLNPVIKNHFAAGDEITLSVSTNRGVDHTVVTDAGNPALEVSQIKGGSGAGGGGASTLDDLTDVTITSPATYNLIRWSGTQWVNFNGSTLFQTVDQDLTDIAALTPTDNDLMQRKAGAWTNRTPAQVKTDLALVKADVGLSNVANVDQTNAANLASGNVPLARLGTGTPAAGKYVDGATGAWTTLPAGGGVIVPVTEGPITSGQVASTASNFTVTLPTHNPGELLVIFAFKNDTGTTAAPVGGGWTPVVQATNSRFHIYTKIAGVAEPNPVFTIPVAGYVSWFAQSFGGTNPTFVLHQVDTNGTGVTTAVASTGGAQLSGYFAGGYTTMPTTPAGTTKVGELLPTASGNVARIGLYTLPGSPSSIATKTFTGGHSTLTYGIAADMPPGSITDADKGDITVSGGGLVWTIDAGAVNLSKLNADTKDLADNVSSLRQLGITSGKAMPGVTKLNGIIAPDGDLGMAGWSITNLAEPAASNAAATKSYVDTSFALADQKPHVKCATTGNITLSGLQTIDGYTTLANDRVLVKSQTAPAENGIWRAAAGAWSRVTDMLAPSQFPSAYVFVEQGTVNADTGWLCTTNPTVTVGTTAITWIPIIGLAKTSTLDSIATANPNAADVPMNAKKITGLADPTLAQDATTKAYTDSKVGSHLVFGTLAPVKLAGLSSVNYAITGVVSVDSTNTNTGDRVLLRGQTTVNDNGLWVANNAGAWTRPTDADTAAEVDQGMTVYVTGGVRNKGKVFMQNIVPTGPIGTWKQEWRVVTFVDLSNAFDFPTPQGSGHMFYNQNQKALVVWDGSTWQNLNGPDVCTSVTRPGFPADGFQIYETDTGLSYVYSGGAWRPVAGNEAAGGDLTGNYPNPTIGASKVTSAMIVDGTIVHGDIAAANKDGSAATPSMRTLGTGSTQAAAGNHTHSGLAPALDIKEEGSLITATPTGLNFVGAGVTAAGTPEPTITVKVPIPTVEVLTSGTTWNKPAGLLYAEVEVVGGGGGGGGAGTAAANQGTAGAGGGGGGYAKKTYLASALSSTEAYSIGGGGTAGAANAGDAGSGGDTTFKGLTGTGGGGGQGMASAATAQAPPGQGGIPTGGDLNINGGDGGKGLVLPVTGGVAVIHPAMGGGSQMAGMTRVSGVGSGTGSGVAGKTYGGGGSGAYNRTGGTQQAGGAGAAGVVIVTSYILT